MRGVRVLRPARRTLRADSPGAGHVRGARVSHPDARRRRRERRECRRGGRGAKRSASSADSTSRRRPCATRRLPFFERGPGRTSASRPASREEPRLRRRHDRDARPGHRRDTAIFTVVHAVLIERLPFQEPSVSWRSGRRTRSVPAARTSSPRSTTAGGRAGNALRVDGRLLRLPGQPHRRRPAGAARRAVRHAELLLDPRRRAGARPRLRGRRGSRRERSGGDPQPRPVAAPLRRRSGRRREDHPGRPPSRHDRRRHAAALRPLPEDGNARRKARGPLGPDGVHRKARRAAATLPRSGG